MKRRFKAIVERTEDGYVAHPIGLHGVVVSDGEASEEALGNLKSATAFHLEKFGTKDAPCPRQSMKGVASLLHERRRKLLLDKLQILSPYGASSAGEVEERIKRGEIQEHPAWEELITLENLDAELERLDEYIRSLQATARSS